MSKIEKLTPEQEAYLPVFRQQYLDKVCDGQKPDPERLRQAFARAYEAIGEPAPDVKVFESPEAVMKALAKDDVDPNVSEGGSIYNTNCLWGTQDLYWICFYRFCQHIGVKFDEDLIKKLDIMEEISVQCEWWWPYEGVVYVSQKAVYVKWDDSQRLHCENGPSVLYEDGFALYDWHGQPIPEAWVTGNPPSIHEALNWPNMDQRAAACEIVGWANILDHEGCRTLEDSGNPVWGKLVEIDIPDVGRERFLYALCGTGRKFALPVPQTIKTVDEAQSALHGGLPVELLKFSVPRT